MSVDGGAEHAGRAGRAGRAGHAEVSSAWRWAGQHPQYADPKASLHSSLREARGALLSALEGLGEYDVRRPWTPTGTNLLGLVKHLTTSESRYLGDAFGRPCPDVLSWTGKDAEQNADMWATAQESRADIVDRYRRVCAHADGTLAALPLDAPGRVPWWPNPDVVLFNVLLHVVVETARHAGHADILREQLARAADPGAEPATLVDYRARLERAARRAGA